MTANVLIEITNINVDKTFTYLVPPNLKEKIKKGIRVKIPFNNRIIEGFVLEISNHNFTNDYQLKEIIDVVDDEPILTDELMSLGLFMRDKYYSSLMSCYQCMLPKALKAKHNIQINKKYSKFLMLNTKASYDLNKLNDSQRQIITLIIKEVKVPKEKLNNISISSVKTLLKKGILIEVIEEKYRLEDKISKSKNEIKLTIDQQNVKDVILNEKNNKIFLLHGVTGSGKTVVYLEVVNEMLKKGKNCIFLVPEISLTPQMVYELKSRFGSMVAVLHSGLSEGEKYDEYRKIKNGDVSIVVGARSAIFAPFKDIGVIIIDEEHTSTYKQDSNPKYNAVDIAIKRAKTHDCIVILGSATPSLDSYARAIKKVYNLVELKNRVNNKKLPEVEIIDMNKEYKKTGIFSQKLLVSLNETLKKKEQAIILLNRRGYSSFVTCSNCGYAVKCPHCDITLTYHKSSNTLRCHYCGYGESKIDICPSCGESAMKNLGIGTEKVEEELNKLLDARIVRMDLDTTVKKGSHEKIVNGFKNYEYDILLGTQMIAKGLNFPKVTLVAIINADTSLMIPNYKSSEYTFQLLMQTAGRSGRFDREGKVIIQTFNPNHYAISLSKNHNYIDFFKEEMKVRKKLCYPPYYFLIYIKIIGKDYSIVSTESNKIGNKIKKELSSSIVLGPTPCNVLKLSNQYRFGITIKYKFEPELESVIKNIINHYKGNNKIKIDIDINPNSF